MSSASAAYGAPSTETDYQIFSSLSLKPILQFITAECVASMPLSGLKVVDFIIQVLTVNRERLNEMISGDSSCKRLEEHASNQSVQRSLCSGTSALARTKALPADDDSSHSARLHELEAQVRELTARLSANASGAGSLGAPHAHFQSDADSCITSAQDRAAQSAVVEGGCSLASSDSPASYADHIALSAKRRDRKQMQAVFDRHKDVEGKGLSKAALMAALTEVSAPVLSSSDGASEDSVFRRADTNCSNYVDLDECGGALALACCACGNAAAAGSCWRPTYPTTSKCSWPITAWA
jgi:hypothetical protein